MNHGATEVIFFFAAAWGDAQRLLAIISGEISITKTLNGL